MKKLEHVDEDACSELRESNSDQPDETPSLYHRGHIRVLLFRPSWRDSGFVVLRYKLQQRTDKTKLIHEFK